MCEFNSKKMKNAAKAFFNKIPNERAQEMHGFLSKKFPYSGYPGQCPVCGKHLSKAERKPSGKCTRSMCRNCYDTLIANQINHSCLLCDGHLPSEKIQEQIKNPREIRNFNM